MLPAALSFFNKSSPHGLIDAFYEPQIERSRLASFAPVVCDCAQNGDEAALSIVQTEAALFADTVLALLTELPTDTPLGLWGGVFEHNAAFRALFSARVKKRRPDVSIGLLPVIPAMGAAYAAMTSVGLRPPNVPLK